MTNRKLNPNHVAVFQALGMSQHSNASKLAETTGIDRKKVMYSLRWLAKKGLCYNTDVNESGGRRRRDSHAYGVANGNLYDEAEWMTNCEAYEEAFGDTAKVESFLKHVRSLEPGEAFAALWEWDMGC